MELHILNTGLRIESHRIRIDVGLRMGFYSFKVSFIFGFFVECRILQILGYH